MTGSVCPRIVAISLLVLGCGSAGLAPAAPTRTATAPTPTAPPIRVTESTPGSAETTRRPSAMPSFRDLPSQAMAGAITDTFQAILDRAVPGTDAHGIGAAVFSGSAGTWSGHAGPRVPGSSVATDGEWHTGSIAKTIVAAEVLRLAERGRLELDDLASSRIDPTRDVDTNGASIRDLLRMRSGLSGHVAPGTHWEYSNGDYVLLGHVIEGVERRTLGDVLTSDILEVPGAEGLRFPAAGSVENAAYGLITDPRSLARWGYALFGGELLHADSLASMVAFDENGYGMGCFDFSADFGRPAAGHLGQEDAWSAALVVFPDRQEIVVTLMDSPDVERTYGIAVELGKAWAPEP